jgi:hypothetical protein
VESFFILDSDIFDSIFLVVSIIFLDESGTAVVMLSVLTMVEESVVVVEEEPDPQAAKTVTAKTVNNFFIRMSFLFNTHFGKKVTRQDI